MYSLQGLVRSLAPFLVLTLVVLVFLFIFSSFPLDHGILSEHRAAAHMLGGDKNKPSSALKPATGHSVGHLIASLKLALFHCT